MRNFFVSIAALCTCVCTVIHVSGQTEIKTGILAPTTHDEISTEQRENIIKRLHANEAELRRQGKLKNAGATARVDATLFQWPVKKSNRLYR